MCRLSGQGACLVPLSPATAWGYSIHMPRVLILCLLAVYAGVWTTREVAAGEELTLDWSCETGECVPGPHMEP